MKKQLKSGVKLLKKIERYGFEAYIVGGFVRDYYMNRKSLDIDICTNATPYDLINIFKDAKVSNQPYSSVIVIFENIRFEITTYRKELRYLNRKPIKIKYINDLTCDLKRRDFTINTLCIDSKERIIDLLNGIDDIKEKLIKMVESSDLKIKEDPLRILRAIRFATILDFKLDENLKKSIIKYRKLLNGLSYQCKKDELNFIFTSCNADYGLKLIRELELDKYLSLFNLEKLKIVDDILGIWAQVDDLNVYSFRRMEKGKITKIRKILNLFKIDMFVLYEYGLEVTLIAALIKGIDKDQIIKLDKLLPIKKRSDIKLDIPYVCCILDKKPGGWIKKVYDDIEYKIISGELINDNEELIDYIRKNIKTNL